MTLSKGQLNDELAKLEGLYRDQASLPGRFPPRGGWRGWVGQGRVR